MAVVLGLAVALGGGEGLKGKGFHVQPRWGEGSERFIPAVVQGAFTLSHTCRNFTIFNLGLASFFSVGAWLNSSAGSTLSHLLYFPTNHRNNDTGTSFHHPQVLDFGEVITALE